MVICVYYVYCALDGRYVTWLPGARVKCWMLLTLYTLPQLAVSAKILCLLMVVICGAVSSTSRSVQLYSYCAHRYVRVHHDGTVLATTDRTNEANLTLMSENSDLNLLIYSAAEDMYLCFNKNWRLSGWRLRHDQALKRKRCLFREEFFQNGYNGYRSLLDGQRYIGFNSRGRQLRRPRSRLGNREDCIRFMKQHDLDIDLHNRIVAGEAFEPHRRQLPVLSSHRNQNQWPPERIERRLRHRHPRRRGRA